MGVPQIILIALWTFALGVCLVNHGQTYKLNFFTRLFSVGLLASLLYWGGFFS